VVPKWGGIGLAWHAFSDKGCETGLSYTGPEGALLHGLKQLGERDAQRPRQPKQILEGRVPASGLNPAQIRPVHLGQFRQVLLGQPSLAERLPGGGHPEKRVGVSATAPSIDAGIIDVLRWSARAS
jgi:hypothetical protein